MKKFIGLLLALFMVVATVSAGEYSYQTDDGWDTKWTWEDDSQDYVTFDDLFNLYNANKEWMEESEYVESYSSKLEYNYKMPTYNSTENLLKQLVKKHAVVTEVQTKADDPDGFIFIYCYLEDGTFALIEFEVNGK